MIIRKIKEVKKKDFTETIINEALKIYPKEEDSICISDFMDIVLSKYENIRKKLLEREAIILKVLKENGFKHVKRVILEYSPLGISKVYIINYINKKYCINFDNDFLKLESYYTEIFNVITEDDEDDLDVILDFYNCIKTHLGDFVEFFKKLTLEEQYILSSFYSDYDGKICCKYNLNKELKDDNLVLSVTFTHGVEETVIDYVIQVHKGVFGYKKFWYLEHSNKSLSENVENDFCYNIYIPKRYFPKELFEN